MSTHLDIRFYFIGFLSGVFFVFFLERFVFVSFCELFLGKVGWIDLEIWLFVFAII
jgi:hypothetical protein